VDEFCILVVHSYLELDHPPTQPLERSGAADPYNRMHSITSIDRLAKLATQLTKSDDRLLKQPEARH
jgi:hypothetical protein